MQPYSKQGKEVSIGLKKKKKRFAPKKAEGNHNGVLRIEPKEVCCPASLPGRNVPSAITEMEKHHPCVLSLEPRCFCKALSRELEARVRGVSQLVSWTSFL